MNTHKSTSGGMSIYQEMFNVFAFPDRAAHLNVKMNSFIRAIGAESCAYVSDNILCHTIIDYCEDIKRLKDFHRIGLTNKEKIIAYTSYWLCRRKPIQLTHKRVDDSYAFINEKFVTSFIEDEVTSLANHNIMPKDLKEHLLYHLKYRMQDPQSIELFIKGYVSGAKP